jgi:hypothetical protein
VNATSLWKHITVEVLPISTCLHHGPVPHRIGTEGLECAVCLARPTRYSLPRGASDGE